MKIIIKKMKNMIKIKVIKKEITVKIMINADKDMMTKRIVMYSFFFFFSSLKNSCLSKIIGEWELRGG